MLAEEHGKDPRRSQVVLDETAELVRAERGVLICRTRHGFVCANAGVDASNAGADGPLVTLPVDPDAARGALRAAIAAARRAPAVVISDSFGRAWRNGQTEAAIGVAGLARWRTGAGVTTPRAASCAPPGSRSPTRRRPPPTSSAARTARPGRAPARPRRATSPATTDPARRRCCARAPRTSSPEGALGVAEAVDAPLARAARRLDLDDVAGSGAHQRARDRRLATRACRS